MKLILHWSETSWEFFPNWKLRIRKKEEKKTWAPLWAVFFSAGGPCWREPSLVQPYIDEVEETKRVCPLVPLQSTPLWNGTRRESYMMGRFFVDGLYRIADYLKHCLINHILQDKPLLLGWWPSFVWKISSILIHTLSAPLPTEVVGLISPPL